jgi:hypothetical protein
MAAMICAQMVWLFALLTTPAFCCFFRCNTCTPQNFSQECIDYNTSAVMQDNHLEYYLKVLCYCFISALAFWLSKKLPIGMLITRVKSSVSYRRKDDDDDV